MKTFLTISLYCYFIQVATCQVLATNKTTAPNFTKTDTSHLKEVIVTGFSTKRNYYQTPASTAVLNGVNLDRFNGISLLPAMNLIPGVVMEERSPGSYRLSIRGSSIRSPFGVRNIKVYLDGIPFTDAGGNTNLNMLDFSTIGKVEIIKGPTGSMFGSGAGGTILLNTQFRADQGLHTFADFEGGSYGLRNFHAGISLTNADNQTIAGFSELKSAGYRANTAMARKEFNYSTRKVLSASESIALTGFYSELHYQTPGGLTLAEYRLNPAQARPATKTSPSAISQQAGIYRKQIYMGISHTYIIAPAWENTTAAYITGDQFSNPFITNYEREIEFGYGMRSLTKMQSHIYKIPFRLVFGAEYQFQYAGDKNYKNKAGSADSLTSDNELKNVQLMAFTQVEAELPLNLLLDAGLSYNRVSYHVLNLFSHPAALLGHTYKPVVVPRIALLRKINQTQSVYISLSGGYSPPANAEALESTGYFNTLLKAENSITLEAGTKGMLLNKLITYDFTLFNNKTSNTIVQRQRAGAQLYFVNEGSTIEKGMELKWDLNLLNGRQGIINFLRVFNSLAINRFYFQHETIGKIQVSGNPLTGTAPYSATLGADVGIYKLFTLNLTSRYSDRIPLNDASTVHSEAFIVSDARIRYHTQLGQKVKFSFFGGIDNAFNKKYSLGNDLNAYGNRYYNAAPLRSFYAGLSISY